MADDENDVLSSSNTASDAMAAQMAMNAQQSPASEAYLEKHGRLLDLQIENLQKLDAYETSHLRWRRFNDQMRGMLQVMLAAVGLLIVAAIGAAVWNAANDNGLVIESFSVPPDLAAKGITGEVVASKILDRLSAFQSQTVSSRASSSYANNWGDDIKVQIPDTGVSIGEFNRYLRQWLGHETRISGEVYRTPTGLAVTARAGADSSPVFGGSEADLGKLIEKAAEHVYSSTQPYRYAIYLLDHGRFAEDKIVLQRMIDSGTALDRAWANVGLEANAASTGDYRAAAAFERRTIEANPNLLIGYNNLVNDEGALQHDEQALLAARQGVEAFARGDASMSPQAFAIVGRQLKGDLALGTGDLAEAMKQERDIAKLPDFSGSLEAALGTALSICGLLHDTRCISAVTASLPETQDLPTRLNRSATLQAANTSLERWADTLRPAKTIYESLLAAAPQLRFFATMQEAPLYALAAAHTGNFVLAHHMIDTTQADCVLCLRYRAEIDALQKNWPGASYWFARAARAAPTSPFVYTDWGVMLLAKGDVAAAIARFKSAIAKGPYFADPLEGWGEALMLQNRSDFALAKFKEASKYAPNWGRLHLKWGEALYYAGKKDESRRHVAQAGRLFLTPPEKSELSSLKAHHG